MDREQIAKSTLPAVAQIMTQTWTALREQSRRSGTDLFIFFSHHDFTDRCKTIATWRSNKFFCRWKKKRKKSSLDETTIFASCKTRKVKIVVNCASHSTIFLPLLLFTGMLTVTNRWSFVTKFQYKKQSLFGAEDKNSCNFLRQGKLNYFLFIRKKFVFIGWLE